nr:immunoglobulin heavy chain junction region [Macaca mulatta]MOX59684.1 immunoglobulin heavy chain junction region [Macaca mulatta]MOX59691.1 immunoglobulin heavy chain junction region [Macaca mulatta]MOX60037.1 immunoglobulin heavy chain junction region [Macaca mulatta]MOX60712.1 immunoglobulin heavy chain junction region [Macaca mulatta]
CARGLGSSAHFGLDSW